MAHTKNEHLSKKNKFNINILSTFAQIRYGFLITLKTLFTIE